MVCSSGRDFPGSFYFTQPDGASVVYLLGAAIRCPHRKPSMALVVGTCCAFVLGMARLCNTGHLAGIALGDGSRIPAVLYSALLRLLRGKNEKSCFPVVHVSQIKIPAIVAVSQDASAPPNMAFKPSFAKSCFRSGAMPPIPPI